MSREFSPLYVIICGKKKFRAKYGFDRWGGQSDLVFEYLSGDFMSPKINEVSYK